MSSIFDYVYIRQCEFFVYVHTEYVSHLLIGVCIPQTLAPRWQAGAGGLYALHGPSEEKWTEEYQSPWAQ